MFRRHVVWAGVGLTLTIAIGSPAIADDTELLIATPNSTGADKPNILFILDSSGSMGTVERTQEPFNPSTVYPGGCDSSQYYWSDDNNVPACGDNNDEHIDKEKFVCAQGVTQMATAGWYKDRMAQFRRRHGDWRWQVLRRDENQMVECEDDSGLHGAGVEGEVYAQIGTDLPPFTDNPDREVAWGSDPTHETYTVYDPNYLNWYHEGPVTEMTRNEIVKTVTKNVIGSINNANVGFMRFHYSQGGPVSHAIKDLDSNRDDAIAFVDSLPASGYTPLSETMYEAALYWHGLPVHYGGSSSTDPDAIAGWDPLTYERPAEYACSKNFIVLLTDGAPTRDIDAYDRVPELPGYTTAMGRGDCSGSSWEDGACLDDVAEYLYKQDINSELDGEQYVTTYTIGFTVDLEILEDTARSSGGEYYLAEDVKSLTKALTEIITSIFDDDISFAAPAVPVDSFNRTQHLNDLYMPTFRASTRMHWPGNLKKYRVANGVILDSLDNVAVDDRTGFIADDALSFWTEGSEPDGANVHLGGAASKLPDPANRNVYANLSGSDLSATTNHISSANAGSIDPALLGLTGADAEPTKAELIDWIRGADLADIDNDPFTNVRRQMGDTLHSQPAVVVYGGGDPLVMDVVVFSATNDGQLHAVNANTGEELWTFIPREFLPNTLDLYFDDVIDFKHYGIDGDIVPVVLDRNGDGRIERAADDFVYLIFGMRRGGNSYYALDVTDKTAPTLKWIRNYPQFGQTWSPPVPARVIIDDPAANEVDHTVLILGAGYDTTHDQAGHPATPDAEGAGIFILDLESGAELWRAGRDIDADLQLVGMTRSIPTGVRVLDVNGDHFADRMYAADLGGQVWRFDIRQNRTPANLVAGGVIAQFGAEGTGLEDPANTRRFFATPDIAMFMDDHTNQRYMAVNVGSGYRAHPLDESAADRFYSLRDPDVFNQLSQLQYDTYEIAYDDDLVNVAGRTSVTIGANDRGWKFVLPPSEKVLAESRTFDDSVYFVSFEPQAQSDDPCRAGLSRNKLYRVSVSNGDPVIPDLDVLDPNDPDEIDRARYTELDQGGIAVRPMFLFPSPLGTEEDCEGADCKPPPVGCVGVECFDPGFENNPVRTLWTQDGVDWPNGP